jgi:hypothetical protein
VLSESCERATLTGKVRRSAVDIAARKWERIGENK